MIVVGVDLAGSIKNDTGVCVLSVEGERKFVATRLVHSDEEIFAVIEEARPRLVAVDAPLSYEGVRRKCDELLKDYGALPATLPGMETLARRGVAFARELEKRNISFIEVYATATAKILGVYNKKEFAMQKSMMSLDLDGDITSRLLVKDELDAISAAVTGYLHLVGGTQAVGDEKGMIVIPKV
jgi:predicted nuclease with RNAse H fold